MSNRRFADYSRNKPNGGGSNGTIGPNRATREPQPSVNPKNTAKRGPHQSPNQTPPGTTGKAGGRNAAPTAASTSRRPSAAMSVMSDASDFTAAQNAAGKKEYYPSDNYDVSSFVYLLTNIILRIVLRVSIYPHFSHLSFKFICLCILTNYLIL